MGKGFLFHEYYLLHDTGAHPERRERLIAIRDHLREKGLISNLDTVAAREATEDVLALIHHKTYIREVKEFCARGGGHLDPDTVASRDSYRAALWAAGGVISAVEGVTEKRWSSVFCAVRPPGHHAVRSKAMGFCLFNNIAIGAAYAKTACGIERVLIVDWDAHHGNGTQEAFYAEPTVLYFSTHQWPLYPGTGREKERGTGSGFCHTINCPMPPGSGDEEFVKVFEERLIPAAKRFRPQLILISAGYDAHKDDPLTSLKLTTQGYGRLAEKVTLISREFEAPVVAVLEGGYNLRALSESVAITIEQLP